MKLLTLKGGGYEAIFTPEYGANCISLVHLASGARLLRSPQTLEEFKNVPYLYGMPMLFPPNRIADGRFIFDGKIYQFPVNEPSRNAFLHGTLYQTPFEVEELTEDRLILIYRVRKDNLYYAYPNAFDLRVEYVLNEAGLTQKVKVVNHSPVSMPIGVGFHTAFPIPFMPEGKPCDIRICGNLGAEYTRNPDRMLTIWEPVADSEDKKRIVEGTFCPAGRPISEQYLCGDDRTMRICDVRSGRAIVYELSENYVSWLIWKEAQSDFVCIEPQSWLVNAPNAPRPEDAGLKAVAPNESIEFSTRTYLSNL